MWSAARWIGRRLASSSAPSPASSSASALSKRRRFYEKVEVVSEDSGVAGEKVFKITLDGRVLKSQQGAPLKMHSEPLALAIYEEWASQKESLEVGHMRLTGLAFTSTDNPFHETRESIVNKILEYLTTDTVLYYSPDNERLLEEQRKFWDPVILDANADLGTNIQPVLDLFSLPTVSDGDRKRFESWLLSYNFWALNGMKYTVESAKSVLIPLGVARHRIRAEEAVRLTLLEQVVQAQTWGQVEWAHGIEEQDLMSRMSAGSLFVYLNSNNSVTINA